MENKIDLEKYIGREYHANARYSSVGNPTINKGDTIIVVGLNDYMADGLEVTIIGGGYNLSKTLTPAELKRDFSLKARKHLLFYRKSQEYGWLSNFWGAKQTIEGIEYKSNEHYYQSMKAKDKEVQEWIRNAPSPYQAMKAGRSLRSKEMVDDWDDKKASVMESGLFAKFLHNPDLRKMLMDTGDAELHENSPTDMYWGIKGKDMLGIQLMAVREELRLSMVLVDTWRDINE